MGRSAASMAQAPEPAIPLNRQAVEFPPRIAGGERDLISVVIPTRNHGAGVVDTVLSVLRCRHPNLEILVVDQSDDRVTEDALSLRVNSPKLRYIRTNTRGISAARNIGVEAACSDVIAMTDDDCQVAVDWLAELHSAFKRYSDVGVVLSNVIAAEHDPRAGFIPAYVRKTVGLARGVAEKHMVEGIGAAMAIRRSAWKRLGGFDAVLGAGTRFGSGEDMDFVFRSLHFGYAVYETPRTHVVHYGFRTWEEGDPLIRSYMVGIGATYAKYFKCGRWSALSPLSALFWRWAFGKPVVDLGRRPPRAARLRAFLDGFRRGLAAPVDPEKIQFAAEQHVGRA